MQTLQYTRINDQCPDGSTFSGRPDLSPALGTWFNCNLNTGEILSLSLREGNDGLILRAYGAGDPSPLDWGETAALPAVWEKKADFDAKFAKFGADAKDAGAKVTDEASFKAIFPTVQKNCGGCHETYRMKKS